ncbi:tyrosine-type recombinase/integrase [Variovorax terrae]|uniref:Integrase family protein n=1 Tax=Variovorax terrae TaxID=2923278 RepID=A0A9X1VVJ5_9BURK|nr:integrase family protein [Variovorax terrae]MCJ0764172.1 integrase family protein [Variovorax terrae]
MAFLEKKLTDSVARGVKLPTAGEVLWWCPETPGLGLRVSATGVKSYIMERYIAGKNKRRTLGRAVGAAAISADTARKLQITFSSELQSGVDRVVDAKAARKVAPAEATTLAEAVKVYVRDKRRAKDGLQLSARTKADYLDMVKKGGTNKSGEPFMDGYLYTMAQKPLTKITATQIRELNTRLAATRGERGRLYALQVLRAVLRWHGVKIPDSPLDKDTAGRDRIAIPQNKGNPTPIPPESLGAWWAAASSLDGDVTADALRFQLLTGTRPGELFGTKHDPDGLLVRDVDLAKGRVFLEDTKNRTNHTIMLSKQAAAIAARHCEGKKQGQKVFKTSTAKNVLAKINLVAEVKGITPHKLRHTFASIADDLVSASSVKRMLNHATAGDVTANSYIGKSENQLRAAWQTVADFIEESSKTA